MDWDSFLGPWMGPTEVVDRFVRSFVDVLRLRVPFSIFPNEIHRLHQSHRRRRDSEGEARVRYWRWEENLLEKETDANSPCL